MMRGTIGKCLALFRNGHSICPVRTYCPALTSHHYTSELKNPFGRKLFTSSRLRSQDQVGFETAATDSKYNIIHPEQTDPEKGPLKIRDLKKASSLRVVPELLESDIEEQFVCGRGPGGQAINKTSILVVLKHKPTNIQVRCQDTRSREQNRTRARRLLLQKLDDHFNPETSKKAVKIAVVQRKKANKARKARKRHAEIARAKEEQQGHLDALDR